MRSGGLNPFAAPRHQNMSNLVKSSADDTERSPISGVAVAWHVLQPNSASDEIPSFPRIRRRTLPPHNSRRPRLHSSADFIQPPLSPQFRFASKAKAFWGLLGYQRNSFLLYKLIQLQRSFKDHTFYWFVYLFRHVWLHLILIEIFCLAGQNEDFFGVARMADWLLGVSRVLSILQQLLIETIKNFRQRQLFLLSCHQLLLFYILLATVLKSNQQLVQAFNNFFNSSRIVREKKTKI